MAKRAHSSVATDEPNPTVPQASSTGVRVHVKVPKSQFKPMRLNSSESATTTFVKIDTNTIEILDEPVDEIMDKPASPEPEKRQDQKSVKEILDDSSDNDHLADGEKIIDEELDALEESGEKSDSDQYDDDPIERLPWEKEDLEEKEESEEEEDEDPQVVLSFTDVMSTTIHRDKGYLLIANVDFGDCAIMQRAAIKIPQNPANEGKSTFENFLLKSIISHVSASENCSDDISPESYMITVRALILACVFAFGAPDEMFRVEGILTGKNEEEYQQNLRLALQPFFDSKADQQNPKEKEELAFYMKDPYNFRFANFMSEDWEVFTDDVTDKVLELTTSSHYVVVTVCE